VDLDVSYATCLVAAVLLGVGFVLQQYSAAQEPESRFLQLRILTDLLRKPRWLLGIGCMIGGYLLAAWSIANLELTVVEPLFTTYLVWALVLAVPMSRQRLKVTEVIGALILICGVTLLSLSRSTTPIGLSFGSLSNWYTAAIIAGIAGVAVQIGRHRQGQVRATLTGVAAGLVLGIQDALTRQALEVIPGTSFTLGNSVSQVFTSWPLYALIGAGIVGVWLTQNAFSAASLHASLPAIAAAEPLAGITLGIVVFGDRIQITPGQLAIEAGGIALLVIGVIAVARSSAFSGLRNITHVIRPGSDSAGSRTPDTGPQAPDESAGAPTPEEPAGSRAPVAPSPDGSPDGSPDRRAPRSRISGRSAAAPSSTTQADGMSLDSPVARVFSRFAHRRQVHDSPSGGEGC
jgi:drug/metabolite transporter (DMT)-like permease